MISLDTETTGKDLRHGAKPYFVTITGDGDKDKTGNLYLDSEQYHWEWAVDPLTREPIISQGDIGEILSVLDELGPEIVLQNPKFDVAALKSIEPSLQWDWTTTQDTLTAGHVLASNQPHDLTSMALQYLGIDILPFEERLKQACVEARRLARSRFPSWRIAKEGLDGMPSAKGSGGGSSSRGNELDRLWKFDAWLPRAIAQELAYAAEHPWWIVTRDYANTDSSVTLLLWKAMDAELHRRGLWEIYQTKLKAAGRITHLMESRGVSLSQAKLYAQRLEYKEEAERAGRTCVNIAASFTHLAVGGIELPYELELPKSGVNNSLRQFLFGRKVVVNKETGELAQLPAVMPVPVLARSEKTGEPSLDKEVMKLYLETLPAKSKQLVFIQNLVTKRKRDTALAYMESYEKFWLPIQSMCPECDADESGPCCLCRGFGWLTNGVGQEYSRDLDGWWRLHPSLNGNGSDTLRFTSANPNEQNISKQEGFNLRQIFGPYPGREWYSCDAENIELRLPAYECGQEEFIQLFERPKDPPYFGSNHLLVAHLLFPKEFEECLRDKVSFKDRYKSTLYQRVKNGNFAVQYGAVDREDGMGTADRTYGIAGAQARIKARFSKQEALNQKWINFANKHGYVETIPDKTVCPARGYPLMCTRSEWGRILPTVPLNYHIQGSAMWWMIKAMIRCQEQLDEWNAEGFDGHIVMQVHDELVFDFPKGRISPVEEKAKNSKFRLGSNLWRIERLRKLMSMGGDDMGVPTPVSCEYHPDNWAEGTKL